MCRKPVAADEADLEARVDANLRRLEEATRPWAHADTDAAAPVDPLEREDPPRGCCGGEHAAASASGSGAKGLAAEAEV
jgi:hypothetical protein